jgi:hypothetical protein
VLPELKQIKTGQPSDEVDWKTNNHQLLEKYTKLLEAGVEEYFFKLTSKK